MNALTLVFVALCVFALAYRYYGLFIANKVLVLNSTKPTPAVAMEDGHDYHATNKYVLFGHHFAAIAAAGPLLGPVLAAQFGYLPGALWIIVGAVVAGAVHDMVVLFASVRHQGKSLSLIAETEIGKRAGTVASFAILFILILTLAGLSIAVVNAMFQSPWGTYTVFCTVPIALLMGVYMHVLKPGDVKGGSAIGVILLALTIITGPYAASNPTISSMLTLSKNQLAVIIPIYGFVASALPVWLLLCPRDYLSTYLKLGTISALAIGIAVVHPQLNMAPVTTYIHGGGPVIPGTLFPFLFITIACGALFGFHAIIGTGTTPKMISNDRDTAVDMARIIHEETGVGAVAITDTERVLAFVGTGSDHHQPGSPISSPLTRQAIAENKVIFADGVLEHYECTLSPTCPLNSVLVVPLNMEDDVIGAIKLYESKNKRFLTMNKSFGEGIAGLLSNQLLLSRYEKQKQLLIMAELNLVQAQVNPHFLFNSLNTIISIIRGDADRARDLLIHLSNFLRKNLKRNSDFSTLKEELDHVNSYLKIEKARFEDRLAVEMDIDPTLLYLRIPTFTLQPLIENAIKHGIANIIGQGVARIRAYRKDDLAVIEIEDNAGTYCVEGGNDGLGIKIVDKRIKFLMGNHFGTKIYCVPHELTRVTVEIPVEVENPTCVP